ncbi:MAG: replication-relaxation family protein [Dehalococcoidia bacterium]
MSVFAQPSQPSTPLLPSDEAVLRDLARYYFLSAQQVCGLHYSRGSLTYVQAKLKRLTDAGFCQRIWLPRPSARGSAPSIYTLGRKGLLHLHALGVEVATRARASEHREHSYLFLSHTLAVNDFLIAAELVTRTRQGLTLASMLHERDLKRVPVLVEAADGKRMRVMPDGWLDLRIDGSYQVCLALELDMGTEEQKAWRRKVRGLVAYANGPYQEAFGTRSLTVAVATTAGEKRLLDLVRWTERELAGLREEHQGDLFVFTSFYPATTSPGSLFFSKRWVSPFGEHLVALIAPE